MLRLVSVLLAPILAFSLVASAQAPANDDCSTATNLGTLPTPNSCTAATNPGMGTSVSTSGTTVGATSAFPYTYQPSCISGGSQAAPSLDVWYTFTISGTVLDVSLTSTFANPNISLWTPATAGSGCSNLQALGCEVGNAAGSVSASISSMTPGTVIYLEVSSNNATTTGTFNLTVGSSNDCNVCLTQSSISVSPPPTNGAYQPGQVVQFCVTISGYNQTNDNWLHGLEFAFGPGWDITSMTTTPAADCPSRYAGQLVPGTWAWYNSVTSQASGISYGPGFFFDGPAGCTCNTADGNPGNNFGDYTNGSCTWTFCVTVQVSSTSAPGEDLSINVTVLGDGISGAWTSLACSNDPTINLSAFTACVPPSMAKTDETCVGGDGTATATAIGVQAPWEYHWSDGTVQSGANGPSTISSLTGGNYTVTVTDALGCTSTASISVTPAVPPVATINPPPPTICSGDNVTLTAGGGATYAWSNGATTAAITVSPTTNTTYTVTVTSATGCTASAFEVVTVNPLPTPSINPSNVAICNGDNTTLTASGGSTYAWSNSVNTAANTVSPTSNTTYTVTVTDANSCTATTSAVVTVNPLPTPSINPATSTICGGNSVTLTASGGATYAWSNSVNTAANTVSPTTNTTYTVTVTDANSCTASSTATVNTLPAPSGSITPSQGICAGNSITLNVTGGVSYVWSTGSTNNFTTVSPASATTYSVTGTDANGCTFSLSTTISVNPLPVASITPNSPTICAGNSTTLTASGAPSFAWSTTATSASITVSPTTTTVYSVTVTDANNCSATANATVNVNALPTPNITPSNPAICIGASQTLAASGGTQYQWSNFATTSSTIVTPTTNTTYSVTVTDANNCSASTSTIVTVNSLPTPSVTPAVSNICGGQPVNLVATGGTNYAWSNGGTNANNTVTPTATTTYVVTVTDANGCSATASADVNISVFITLTKTVVNVSCAGGSDGAVFPVATGGQNPYTFLWSNTSTTQSIQNVRAGNYSVTATDLNGCSNSTSATVAEPTALLINGSGTDISCNGANDGTITITNTGGTPPYVYSWNDGPSTLPTRTGLAAGTYTVTATDGNNCTTSNNITIAEPSPLAISNTLRNPTCATIDPNGDIALTVTGGTVPYQYQWSNGGGTAEIQDLGPGAFLVTVTDANNCSAQDNFNLQYDYQFDVAALPGLDSIFLGDSTTLLFTLNGSAGNYTIEWAGDGNLSCTDCNSPIANPDVTTIYTVTITNDSGCSAVAMDTVVVVPKYVLYVPNAFTPNGDQHNEYFSVYGNLDVIQSFSMKIFDRWGELVYQSSDPKFKWDGTYHGNPLSPDVFVYQVKVSYVDGYDPYPKKGSITLLR